MRGQTRNWMVWLIYRPSCAASSLLAGRRVPTQAPAANTAGRPDGRGTQVPEAAVVVNRAGVTLPGRRGPPRPTGDALC